MPETVNVFYVGFLKVLQFVDEACLVRVPKLATVVQARNDNELP